MCSPEMARGEALVGLVEASPVSYASLQKAYGIGAKFQQHADLSCEVLQVSESWCYNVRVDKSCEFRDSICQHRPLGKAQRGFTRESENRA